MNRGAAPSVLLVVVLLAIGCGVKAPPRPPAAAPGAARPDAGPGPDAAADGGLAGCAAADGGCPP